MRSPPERKSPSGGRGSENRLVRGEIHTETYAQLAENASPRCAECRAFYPYETGGGECRALPPRIVEDSFMHEGHWPRVGSWDWCGTFVGRADA